MPNTVTSHTKAVHAAMRDLLDFGDLQDFEDAKRGFVAALEETEIGADTEGPAWDFAETAFLEGACPETVNPSLWRQAQLTKITGLFTIHPRIHQIRGHDLANMTLIEGETGWIIIDTLFSVETARASLALANKHLGEKPVAAVIYTHTHADHFGGVRGLISEDMDIPIIAPEGFMDYAISENVLAGNAMSRRAQYQFGTPLPTGPTGHVSCGLGHRLSRGTMSLIPPNVLVSKTGETRTIDGVEITFQMASGTEAPAEFILHFPQFRALCTAEVTSHHMHNILTPRGAEVRNALVWSKCLEETVSLFADKTDLLFACHHWPTWSKDAIRPFLERQSDLYRFIHDETLRLANHGHTMHEIADLVELPEALAKDFACRGYYGTLKHNVKAVYQFYLGWWDGNPATFDPLPPAETGARFVRAMGGAASVLAEGQRAFVEGDYRWAADVLGKLVFADPNNADARALLADVFEQQGFQAEAGTWRGLYLTGAQELREGVATSGGPNTATWDIISNMGVEMMLDLLCVKFNPAKAQGSARIAFALPEARHILQIRNGVLTNTKSNAPADVTFTLSEDAFFRFFGKLATPQELIEEGSLAIDGEPAPMLQLVAALDDFDPRFEIVRP